MIFVAMLGGLTLLPMMSGQLFRRMGDEKKIQQGPASEVVQSCQWLTDAELGMNPAPRKEGVKKNYQWLADEDVGMNPAS